MFAVEFQQLFQNAREWSKCLLISQRELKERGEGQGRGRREGGEEEVAQ